MCVCVCVRRGDTNITTKVLYFLHSAKLSTPDAHRNLVSYHVTPGRRHLAELLNKHELPSLHEDNPPIRVNRYANGVRMTRHFGI